MKKIGCHRCLQEDDIGYEVSETKYDAGWMGKVETRFVFFNGIEYMQSNGSWKENDRATLYFSTWRYTDANGSYEDELFSEEFEIKFCPFCGANLKKVREYVKTLGQEDNDKD